MCGRPGAFEPWTRNPPPGGVPSQARLTTGTSASSLVNLTQIGISFKADGSMGLDTAKLNKALGSNRTGVAQLFSGADGKSGYRRDGNDQVRGDLAFEYGGGPTVILIGGQTQLRAEFFAG